jgi:hypothetical protein
MAVMCRLVRGQSHWKTRQVIKRNGWVKNVMEEEAEIARAS